jgi:ubiquitin-protein ligase
VGFNVLTSTSVHYTVIVSLHCEFPPTYPSESPPNLKIQVEKGLSANQGDEVKELADRVAQENLGAPSIFAVAEAVKEWLVDNNIAGQDGSMYSGTFFRRRLFAAFSADPH